MGDSYLQSRSEAGVDLRPIRRDAALRRAKKELAMVGTLVLHARTAAIDHIRSQPTN